MTGKPDSRQKDSHLPAGHDDGLRPGWFWSALAITLALNGFLGLYFVTEGLDRADKLASVTATFLGIMAIAGPALTWLWRRSRQLADPGQSPWGSSLASTINEVSVSSGTPEWPQTFTGYRFDREGSAGLRLFSGKDITVITDFPATMNGCAHQRFFIRWRSLGDRSVEASLVSTPDLITVHEAVTGSSGWMASHGCGQPAWKFLEDENSMADIQVNWQVWVPSA